MIIDGFIFFDELEILEGRLEYLYDVVDKFIIVEADTSYMGRPKPYNFYNNMSRYSKYMDKIIYNPVRLDPYKVPFTPVLGDTLWWRLENHQRMGIGEKLQGFSDDDIIMVSDIDEVPLKSTIAALPGYLEQYGHVSLRFFLYYYNFNNGRYGWNSTVATRVKVAREITTQRVKELNCCPPHIDYSGYHISYFFPSDRIKNKIENAAHPELIEPKFVDEEQIKQRVRNGLDCFERLGNDGFQRCDPSNVDKEFYEVFSKYQYMGD